MAAAAFAQSREIEYQPIVPRRRQSRRFWSHAMLFVAAKVSQLNLLPQGQPEKYRRVKAMVGQLPVDS